jgi:hypothetical protein
MSDQAERWLPIPHEHGYEVSTLGRVRSWRQRGRGGLQKPTPHPLRPYTNRYGYLVVQLSGRKAHTIHALVLLAFVGPRPPGMVSRHFPDRDRTNNRVENLSWGTPTENTADMTIHGTMPTGDRSGARKHPEKLARGERVSNARLKASDIPLIRAARKAGESWSQIATRFGVGVTTVCSVVNGRTWSHVT